MYPCLQLFRPKKDSKKKGFPNISGPIETLPELMAVCEGRFDALIALLEEEMPRQQLDQVSMICLHRKECNSADVASLCVFLARQSMGIEPASVRACVHAFVHNFKHEYL